MDICVWDTGKIVLLSAGTVRGRVWLTLNMPSDIQRWGICAYAVLPERAQEILRLAVIGGMTVEVEA